MLPVSYILGRHSLLLYASGSVEVTLLTIIKQEDYTSRHQLDSRKTGAGSGEQLYVLVCLGEVYSLE